MTNCREDPDGWLRRRHARVAQVPRGEPSPRDRGGDHGAVVTGWDPHRVVGTGPVTARPEQQRSCHSIREERDIVKGLRWWLTLAEQAFPEALRVQGEAVGCV